MYYFKCEIAFSTMMFFTFQRHVNSTKLGRYPVVTSFRTFCCHSLFFLTLPKVKSTKLGKGLEKVSNPALVQPSSVNMVRLLKCPGFPFFHL